MKAQKISMMFKGPQDQNTRPSCCNCYVLLFFYRKNHHSSENDYLFCPNWSLTSMFRSSHSINFLMDLFQSNFDGINAKYFWWNLALNSEFWKRINRLYYLFWGKYSKEKTIMEQFHEKIDSKTYTLPWMFTWCALEKILACLNKTIKKKVYV